MDQRDHVINESALNKGRNIKRLRENDPNLKRLKILFKSDEFFDEMTNQLHNNTSAVIHLDLSHNFFNDNITNSLANLLARNTTIESLDLSECEMKSKHTEKILHSLKTNKSLTKLILPAIFGDIAKEALSKFLYHHENPMLSYILGRILGKEAAAAIAYDFLPMNITLKELQFRNNFGEIESIAKSLEKNSSLEEVHIFISICNEQNAKAIVNVLKNNRILKQIYLSWGYINIESMGILQSEALQRITFKP